MKEDERLDKVLDAMLGWLLKQEMIATRAGNTERQTAFSEASSRLGLLLIENELTEKK